MIKSSHTRVINSFFLRMDVMKTKLLIIKLYIDDDPNVYLIAVSPSIKVSDFFVLLTSKNSKLFTRNSFFIVKDDSDRDLFIFKDCEEPMEKFCSFDRENVVIVRKIDYNIHKKTTDDNSYRMIIYKDKQQYYGDQTIYYMPFIIIALLPHVYLLIWLFYDFVVKVK